MAYAICYNGYVDRVYMQLVHTAKIIKEAKGVLKAFCASPTPTSSDVPACVDGRCDGPKNDEENGLTNVAFLT